MRSISLIAVFVLWTCFPQPLCAEVEPSAPERPNFLVILCDDLGYGDLASYGNPTIQTPNLDRLAAEGIRLTSAYAAAPVCSPSRAGLLTGRTPNRVGVYDWIPEPHPMHLRSNELTIATLLKQDGYQTAHLGKWHLNGRFNSDEQPQPDDHGFDYWFSTQNNAFPSHADPKNYVRNGKKTGSLTGYSCGIVADEADRWLREERAPDAPFFMFVCFHEPHEPVNSPEELTALYPNAIERGEALYYANVTNMDRAVGSLMESLDALDLEEQTLVIFTSDNGPETLNRYRNAWRSHGSPGPLRGMKLHIYEGGIRVPGILRWTGRIAPSRVVNEPVSSVDLLPTICELAGVPAPDDRTIDGTSIAAFLDGDGPINRHQPLYWNYYDAIGPAKVAIRDGDWKVVAHWNVDGENPGSSLRPGDMQMIKSAQLTRFELYNLRVDIGETRDLATSHPERLQRLAERLEQIDQAVRDEGPFWDVPSHSR